MTELVATLPPLPAPIGSAHGVQVRLLDVPLVSVLAHRGQDLTVLGIEDASRQSEALGATVLGIGPGRWLFLGRELAQLAATVGTAASLSDQTDAYALYEISGPRVRNALNKGMPLDLHPSVFSGQVGVTIIAHIGAIIWQAGPNAFVVAVFRSCAGSFCHWLSASAAEFGLEVL